MQAEIAESGTKNNKKDALIPEIRYTGNGPLQCSIHKLSPRKATRVRQELPENKGVKLAN